jgi:ABC-2 type transport system ATP-binding protein
LCDRVAIIASGHLAALGTPRELTSTPRAEAVTFTTGRDLDAAELARALGLPADRVQSPRSCEYRVLASGTPQLIAALSAFLAAHEITLGMLQANERSLEDVFLAITAEPQS